MEHTDPLTRLSHILHQLAGWQNLVHAQGVQATNTGGISLGMAICAAMNRDPQGVVFTLGEQLKDYATLLDLCADAEEYVNTASPEKAKARNLEYLLTFTRFLRRLSVHSGAEELQPRQHHAVTSEHYERLAATAENLSNMSTEATLDDQQIGELLANIDGLVTLIRSSPIDDLIKARLLETFGIIRMECTRINIVGPREMVENLDRLLGQSVRAAMAGNTPEQQRSGWLIFTGVVDFVEKAGKIADAAQKYYPLVERGIEVLKQLPG